MSSLQYLREFVNQRLTAAAEEIFGVFEKTIVEYEAELERQRRLLDILLKPGLKLHRIELPQQHVCLEEEVLTEQQLSENQQRNSSLDQEDPVAPQIKEEQEEVEVKQETNTFMLIPVHEESEHCEAEANSEQQLPFHSSAVAESQDQKGGQDVEPPSTRNVESQPEKRSPINNVYTTHTGWDAAEEKERREFKKKKKLHKEVTSLELNNLEDDKDEMNTKKTTKWAVKTLKDFLANKNMDNNFESYTATALNDILQLFYASVQSTKEGGEYSVASLRCLRAELLQQAVTEEEEEEALTEQQLWDHEEPEDPQTKVEQEAQCTGSEGHQLKVKQETNTFMMIPAYEESKHSSPISESQCNTLVGKTELKCNACGKDCKYQSLLKIHQRIHTGERPYVCDFCGKRYSQKSAFNDHLRLHTGEKPYLCKICGKVLRSHSGLVVHLRIHTGEKPYLCNTCGKTFNNVSVLKRHTRIHTGEKPYQCNICGKRFNQNSSLKVHLNIHTDERPYICNTCGKRFNHNKSLYVHLKMHKDENSYVCDICGKTFKYKKSLNVHLKIHSNEKKNS